ncbi:hypothetical protein RFI_12054 [Reticulomyxa filosa]|uniref:Uncharacterized protein n=1 Tax=Reticulomyxa filosa TaxID=46433 RepID=X6NFJ4_RETFI|nr:hypothetical protein RFI_12054 [Reticulomyxa filosa]|eukprot:ETO25090.1 hypothetical protein RFI_12054 [Reticulomyxa filosa]
MASPGGSLINENARLRQNRINFRQGNGIPPETTNLVITHTKDWWSFMTEALLVGGSLAALGYMFSQLLKHSQDADGQLGRKKVAENIKAEIIKRIEVSKFQYFGKKKKKIISFFFFFFPKSFQSFTFGKFYNNKKKKKGIWS